MGADEARKRISAALDAIDAAHDVLRDTSSDVVGNAFRVDVAERLEIQDRANRGLMYRFFGEIADPPDDTECIPAMREGCGHACVSRPARSSDASDLRRGSGRAGR